ncbi:MAG: septum formation initiator family protein [Acidobacteriota bacterium]
MSDLRHVASAPISAPASSRARKRASAAEHRERRRSAITWGLLIVLGALLVNAVVGDGGYLATVRASREEAQLAAEVTALWLENQQLVAQGKRLEDDTSAIEEVARRDLSMIRPGETMVVIRNAATAAPPATTK